MIPTLALAGFGRSGAQGTPTPPITPVTWNPADMAADLALSNGDLTVTKTTGDAVKAIRATLGRSTGKYYYEIYLDAAGGAAGAYMIFGIANGSMNILTTAPGQDTNGYGYYQDTGEKYYNNVLSAFGGVFQTNGDVVGIAVDLDAGLIWWSLNNTFQASGNPAAGTNEAFSGISGTMFPCASLYRFFGSQHIITGQFKAADLTYSPPSGFSPWES